MSFQDHYNIIQKLKKRYSSINLSSGLLTNNDTLHTKIFLDLIEGFKPKYDFVIDKQEFPLLECYLENKNYFLMTTNCMYSWYNGMKYELKYSEFWWEDPKIFSLNLPLQKGKTKIFKYYSITKIPFWYEIDSNHPADAAHNCILYNLRNPTPPPLDELFR